VTSEEELESAVAEALAAKGVFLLNVVVDKKDVSSGIRRMAEALGKRI
jgi:thiamine pyrophosphate-dependent acetolactate synthase large subunit-like protein